MSNLLVLSLLAALAESKLVIDIKSHTTPLQPRQFDSLIGKHRSWQVGTVFFYDAHSAASTTAFKAFDSVAADLEGMFKFAGVDCSASTENEKFCKDHVNGKDGYKLPAVVVYPKNPQPSFVLESIETDTLKKALQRQLSSEHVTIINNKAEMDTFLKGEDEHTPKIVLFSSSLTVSPMFKALSTELRKEMRFAQVKFGADAAVDKQFNVKKAPTLTLYEKSKKVQHYTGELKYKELYAWANVRRETFVYSDPSSQAANTASDKKKPMKPWLSEEVPEMTKESANDLCFKQEGLCLIYLKSAGPITKDEIDMLTGLKQSTDLAMRFSWIDASKEAAYAALFNYEHQSNPSAVIFNPHKRLRYAVLPDGMVGDKEGIKELLDRVSTGDARFTGVKGQVLPEFTKRPKVNDEL